jgi:anti-sigma factor RsiW
MAQSDDPSRIECRQIAELLTDYVDGTLPRTTSELIDWHIEGCGPCVAFVNTFRATRQAVSRLAAPPPPMPDELKQRLLKVLCSGADRPPRERT